MKIWKFRIRLRYFAWSVASLFFILGLLFTQYKSKIDKYKRLLISKQEYSAEDGFNSLSKYIFTDPIEGNTFFYPTIKSTEDLGDMIRKLSVPIYEIDSVYDKIHIVSNGFWNKDIFRVCFTIGCDTMNAFAYVKKINNYQANAAFCLIPQSGLNTSSKIFKQSDGDSESDNNGDDILVEFGDVFTLIKLNEDCLAINNGYLKINYNNLVPSLINNSSSYSYHYIVCSIALTKYLKTVYNKVGVAGLSQGGLAALINSIATKPNFAIIVSGYSVINDNVNLSGITQIIYPNISKEIQSDSLMKRIGNMRTQYLFTYGKTDDDVYKVEAKNYLTANKFSSLTNTTFLVHPFGHIFEKGLIQAFFYSQGLQITNN